MRSCSVCVRKGKYATEVYKPWPKQVLGWGSIVIHSSFFCFENLGLAVCVRVCTPFTTHASFFSYFIKCWQVYHACAYYLLLFSSKILIICCAYRNFKAHLIRLFGSTHTAMNNESPCCCVIITLITDLKARLFYGSKFLWSWLKKKKVCKQNHNMLHNHPTCSST